MPPFLAPIAVNVIAALAAEPVARGLKAWVPPAAPAPLAVSGRPFLPPNVSRGRGVPLVPPRIRGDRRRRR
jgi:hypothetical protein